MLRKLGRVRVAVLTGWAVDPSCRFRYGADAAFPLSDHADFPDLIEMVKRVNPKKVYTLHGFAADFAERLRELGFDAHSLSEEEQMLLPIPQSAKSTDTHRSNQSPAAPVSNSVMQQNQSDSTDRFEQFANTALAIASTSGKLEKVRLLAEYLRSVDASSLASVVTWFTGSPFAATENKVMQLGWAILRDAICAVGQVSPGDFHQVYLKHSDLGQTAFEILSHRPALVPFLSVSSIAAIFAKLHAARGASGIPASCA